MIKNKLKRIIYRINKEGKGKRTLSLCLALLFLFTLFPYALFSNPETIFAAASYQQLTVSSGFNADVICAAGETFSNTDSAESNAKVNGSGNAFYSSDYISTGGFPTNRIITDESGSYSGLTWKLADYKSKNALRLSPGSEGTLKFSTVGCYQKLYFLVTAGGVGTGSNAAMKVVVTYSDGTTSNETFTVVDWYDKTNFATDNYKRIGSENSPNGSNSGAPYLTRCVMDIDTTKLIYNINISNSAANRGVYVCVYAVTGLGANINTPTNLKLTTGCINFKAEWSAVSGAASYRIDVAKDSNFTQIVNNYNNTTIPNNYCYVSGLTKGNKYYLRVRAANSAGGQSLSSGYQSIVVSGYEWNYSSSGNVARAVCKYPGCDFDTVPKALTATLQAEDVIYDRNFHPASFSQTEVDWFYEMTGEKPGKITYYETQAYGQVTGGTLMATEPRDIGYYYATATVAGQTVVKAYRIYKEDALYHVGSLNNLVDEEGAKIKTVSGETHNDTEISTKLTVVLTDSEDTISLYKIADVNWNTRNDDYDDPVWTETVSDWLRNKNYQSVLYSSPMELAKGSNTVWTSFYQALLSDGGNVLSLTDSEGNLLVSPVTLNGVKCQNVASNERSLDGVNYYTVFDKLEFGTYAIMAKDGSDVPYAPYVINIVPTHNGPWNSWQVNIEYVAYLKDSQASMEKKINGGRVDTMAIGDEEDFEIEFKLPTLYKDRVTLTGSDANVNAYTMVFEDQMAKSFKRTTDLSSIVLSYRYVDTLNQAHEATFTNETVSYNAFADSTYSAKVKTPITEVNKTEVTYDSSFNEELAGKYYVTMSDTLYTLEETSGKDKDGKEVDILRVRFNVGALKAWVKNNDDIKTITHVMLSYKAKVTDKAQTGNNENFNRAILKYEGNITGSEAGMRTAEDMVYGYTYGLHVYKYDGASVEEGDPKPIEGAHFSLYKEIATFIDGVWMGDIYGSETDPIGKELSSLAGANYYIYEYTAEESGTTSSILAVSESDDEEDEETPTDVVNYVSYSAGQKVSRVFEKVVIDKETNPFDGSFISSGTSEGDLIVGLDVGNYVLVETLPAPTYNLLAEDILITIKPLSEEKAEVMYQGSLYAFEELDGTTNETGIYSLEVLNYKGFTLPSTGGIGTLIFTILGVALMIAVMIIMLVKRQKISY